MSKKKQPKEPRADNGQFLPGNTVGLNTRFQKGHDSSSKYSASYPEQMINYFLSSEHAFPTFAGFGVSIGVLIETLERWRDKYPQFKNAYALCKQIQEDRLCNGGLNRMYDPSMAKFLLQNNHGMREKSEQEINATANGAFKVEISYFDEENDNAGNKASDNT
ncbi:MAG: hypothetical protein IKA64_01850 [Clostridia bacterium]|nr:hypothetical protein [Clostridia bacterium]